MKEISLTFKSANGRVITPGRLKVAGDNRLQIYVGDAEGEEIRVYASLEHVKKLYEGVFGDYLLRVYPEKRREPMVEIIRHKLSAFISPKREIIEETT